MKGRKTAQPPTRKKTVNKNDVLQLVSHAFENDECRKVLEDIASSTGYKYMAWRLPTDEENEILVEHRKKWLIENNFGWPPSVLVATKLGLYFPICIWIIREKYTGVLDLNLHQYLDAKI